MTTDAATLTAPVRRTYTSPLPAPPSLRDIQRDLGRKIRTLRLMRGLTQEQLGKCVNVSMQQIQKYETATANVSAARLLHIATALGVAVADMWGAE